MQKAMEIDKQQVRKLITESDSNLNGNSIVQVLLLCKQGTLETQQQGKKLSKGILCQCYNS
jgi:hypothetical protein